VLRFAQHLSFGFYDCVKLEREVWFLFSGKAKTRLEARLHFTTVI